MKRWYKVYKWNDLDWRRLYLGQAAAGEYRRMGYYVIPLTDQEQEDNPWRLDALLDMAHEIQKGGKDEGHASNGEE